MISFLKNRACFFVFSLVIPVVIFSSPASMLLDLQIIHSIFDTSYAPKEWKELHLGWNLDKEYLLAQKKITDNPELSVREFHKIVRDFIRSNQDYHVSCHFEGDELSLLPFTVKSVNGRYFVYSISPKKLDTKVFPINIGDELLSIDEEQVDAIAKKIIAEIGIGVVDTDQALADELITLRTAGDTIDVPKGVVQVKFADKESGKIKEYQMVWHHQPESYTFHKDNFDEKDETINFKMEAADWIVDLTKPREEEARRFINGKYSDLPKLGKVIWENDSENIFQAYIFETDEGDSIGFLRIPHYRGDEIEVEELTEIIKRFETETTKLVIDQRNNGGGSLYYLYGIASLFAEKPLKAPKHHILMTSSSNAQAKRNLEILNCITTHQQAVDYFEDDYYGTKISLHLVEMLKTSCRFMISEWDLGKNISDPTFLGGIDQINPHHEVTYTKPVLLLINELDFSCGDLFPALLQDNKRATLMGNRTAGAGGAVKWSSFPNRNGIAYIAHTWTLSIRPGSDRPIENLGVTPDILYKTTEEDLRNDFKEHKAAILDVLKTL